MKTSIRNLTHKGFTLIELIITIVIIGKDGNIDLQTANVIPSSRVREVLVNSFSIQSAARK